VRLAKVGAGAGAGTGAGEIPGARVAVTGGARFLEVAFWADDDF
jgi:hypothetical protein